MCVSGKLSVGLIRCTGKYDNISFRIKTPYLNVQFLHLRRYIFFMHGLSAKRTNKFESNNIKFHKSLYAETGKLEGSLQICGCTRQSMSLV